MKRALLLVAALGMGAVPAMAQSENGPVQGSAGANGAGANQLNQMFNINANTPGVLNFSGSGTAQFNNTLSTANNFNIGSSTALGVNASVSSTPDYTGTATAYLGMAEGSKLQQTIGSSASAANQQAVAEALASSANSSATEAANAKYGSNFADWSAKFEAYVAEKGYSTTSLTSQQKTEIANELGGYFTSAAQWESGWEEGYRDTYQTAYSAASSDYQSQQSSNSEDVTGKISAIFSTTEKGSATVGGQAGSFSASDYAATIASSKASAAYESTKESATYDALVEAIVAYSDESTALTETDVKAAGNSTEELRAYAASLDFKVGWSAEQVFERASETGTKEAETAFNSTYSSAYSGAFSAASSVAERSTNSNVNVVGLGSIANVNTNTDSLFSVDLASRMPTSGLQAAQLYGQNGTANGSSTSNLSTSSYASQSVNTTASAFMQAFSAE